MPQAAESSGKVHYCLPSSAVGNPGGNHRGIPESVTVKEHPRAPRINILVRTGSDADTLDPEPLGVREGLHQFRELEIRTTRRADILRPDDLTHMDFTNGVSPNGARRKRF
jgi:hypothetical protein